ncbi:MAG: helix-hairpin-helix domain-containing protein [Gammaproteobacteria bacterium]|nr:helix-hairpin-helix domain-containing protein [Gammaproteobacteria bacterium]
MLKFAHPLLMALCLNASLALAAEPLDLNTATAAQLESLHGIGPAKAQAIIDYRSKHGPFQKVEDLEKVDGIGAKMMEKLKPMVTVKAPSTPAAPGTSAKQ